MRVIRRLLDAPLVETMRRELAGARWIDGRATAGRQSALAKDNQQLAVDDPLARRLGDAILEALAKNEQFVAAALPAKVHPPLFNRYSGGQSFGAHTDNAIRQVPGTPHRVRTDLSMTVFLSEPGEYDGGELVADFGGSERAVKLEAGDAVLYPASTLHRVTPVTRGERIASFFWIQSMVREEERRAILLRLDESIQRVETDMPGSEAGLELVGVYHQLLRLWAET